jgi:predicted transcriptional regulator
MYHTVGGIMARLRKDKPASLPGTKFTIYVPVELVDALNRVADTKGISRNALIVQALVKLFKRHIEEAK